MSKNKVEQELLFIIKEYIYNNKRSKKGKVIAVNGLWGTGKTYLWNSFFCREKQNIFFNSKIIICSLLWSYLLYLSISSLPNVFDFIFSLKWNNLLLSGLVAILIIAIFLKIYFIYWEKKIRTYSYISLFGINSLDDFKLNIFRNMLRIKKIKKNQCLLKSFAFTKKYLFPYWKGISLFGIRIDLRGLGNSSFNAINNSLICIDDIERRGNNLDIKDIMGLVSFLKESRNCTIVLLYNYEQLEEKKEEKISEDTDDTKSSENLKFEIKLNKVCKDVEELKNKVEIKNNTMEDFNILLEKVIDIPILFKPTTRACIKLAFKNRKMEFPDFKCNSLHKEIAKYVNQLEITNIRVIIFILDYFERIREQVNNFRILKELMIKPLVLFVYWRINNFPNLRLLELYDLSVDFLRTDKMGTKVELAKNYKNILIKYDWRTNKGNQYINSFVIGYVNDGYVADEKKLVNLLNDEAVRLKEIDSKEIFLKFYNVVYKSFSQENLLQYIDDMFNKDLLFIDVSDLENIVLFLKEQKKEPIAKKIINKYVELNKEREYFKDYLENYLKHIQDKDIKKIFEKYIQPKKDIRKIEDIISSSIFSKPPFKDNDIICLESKNLDDFVSFIKKANSRQLENLYNYYHALPSSILSEKILKALIKVIDTSKKNSKMFNQNKERLKRIFYLKYDDVVNVLEKRKKNE